MTDYAADLASIRAAAERIAGHVHRTPVLTSSTFDEQAGRQLYFKCENFQRVGAFKMRGALNAVLCLDEDEARAGVVTHSSGNFAQALALAARIRGIPAHIVMPSTAPEVKQRAVAGYGGLIRLCEPTLEARETTAAAVCRETGGTLLHPFNHADVVAGQGTIALELVEQAPDLDVVLVPVGGGGLISGIALGYAELKPDVSVIGAEPLGADDAARSRQAGAWIPQTNPDTVADGLLTSLGSLTWPVVRDVVKDIIVIDDDAIIDAMHLVWERMKIVIEPSAAVGVAAALTDRVPPDARRVGVVLSGGNVDLSALPWMSR